MPMLRKPLDRKISDEATCTEFPNACGRLEESAGRVDASEPYTIRERSGADRDENEHHALAAFACSRQRQKQDRPNKIELLFHRKRPGVQQGVSRRFPLKIVQIQMSKIKIAGVENRDQCRLQDSELHDWADHDGFNNANYQYQQNGRGQQPPRAPRVEPDKADAAGPLNLLNEEACDQVARKNEKDVHADKAAS